MVATIESIKEDLKRCREAKKLPAVFGAESHGFKLNSKLRISVVSNFESKHEIQLPEGYRRFLTEVGNGGAGPYYGVFKFREMDDGLSWKENDGSVGKLALKFPHRKAWNLDIEYPDEDDYEDEDEYEKEIERLEEKYWDPKFVNGAIPICHQGCALRNWLVITGPEAGNVWEDLRADEAGLRPSAKKGKKRLTFLEWYDSWLQKAISKLPRAKAK